MKLKYMTRREATGYLRENGIAVCDGYLAQGARLGTGPQFRYLGLHPVYTQADLDAWIEARKAGVLEAFLQREHLRLGPPTRTARRSPGRSHPGPRRKRTASDLSLPP